MPYAGSPSPLQRSVECAYRRRVHLRLRAPSLRRFPANQRFGSIVEHQITRVITVMVITGNYSTGKILPESIFGYRVMTFGVEG